MTPLRAIPLALLVAVAAAPPTVAAALPAPVIAGPDTTEPTESTEPAEIFEAVDGRGELAAAIVDETDPARRRWLQFLATADTGTFAGGAELRDLVDGRRVLMIGDSLMASTSRRYGGEMCDRVPPMGWNIEIDAEVGRFVDFGKRVLDERLNSGFDAAVMMLGNNYGANQEVFEDYLREIVDRLEPRPTVLLTVTEFRADRKDVNDTIYEIATEHDNVQIVDWAGETAANPALLAGDGLHLNGLGRARFADLVAARLGRAPGWGPGDCLSSGFGDDSAGTDRVEGLVTTPPSTGNTVAPATTAGAGTAGTAGTAGDGPTTVPGGGDDTSPPTVTNPSPPPTDPPPPAQQPSPPPSPPPPPPPPPPPSPPPPPPPTQPPDG